MSEYTRNSPRTLAQRIQRLDPLPPQKERSNEVGVDQIALRQTAYWNEDRSVTMISP